ncbi:MAG: hypothetical protein WCF94_03680 [bacterium]
MENHKKESIEHKWEVTFELPTLESEAKLLHGFCFVGRDPVDFRPMIYKQHPKLKEMIDGTEDKDEFLKKCREYAESYIKEKLETLKQARDNFQAVWERDGGDAVVDSLCEEFEVDKEILKNGIKANVSINPICPRYLDKMAYSLFYEFSDVYVKKVSIHEIIHFLNFHKWRELFPETKRNAYESPHSEWILSEILVHVIINENQDIQNFVENSKSNVYMPWQKILVEGKTLVEYFTPFYLEHLAGKITFAEFLQQSWTAYKKNKVEIEGEINKK